VSNSFAGFPLNPSSLGVNDQLLSVGSSYFFQPGNAPGPSFRGAAAPPQTIPTGAGASLGQSAGALATASGSPWSFAGSPLPILLIMLVVGLLGLRYIHWR
jgi:hypothetical protein